MLLRISRLSFEISFLCSISSLAEYLMMSVRELIEHKKDISKDSLEILKSIHVSINWYNEMYFKFDKMKIKDLYLNRDKVIRTIKKKSKTLSEKELMLVEYHEHILEFLVDITQARMGLEFED
jgi:hypothetical protein